MGKSQTPSLFDDEDSPLLHGRDSLNFAEFPMALLTDRTVEGKNKLVFSDVVSDASTGKEVIRKLTIAAPADYGLPTAKDEEVILGLLALTKQKNNFSDSTVEFNKRELITILGWPDQGHYYQRIVDSLNRWASVFLHYENAWWDNHRKEWLDVSFHVFDTVTVTKPQRAKHSGKIIVEWGKTAFGSFQANYLKQIDLNFYQSLESATAKRLYRYLDKHFYRRLRLEFDLATLAYEHVGMSRDYEAWKLKQKLAPAIEELEVNGYLVVLSKQERYIAAGKGKWRVVFVRNLEPKAIPEVAKEVKVVDPAPVQELINRGIHRPTALVLVESTSEEKRQLCIEAFDWLMAKKDKRVSKNPPGYLIESIRSDFPLPHGFVPKTVQRSNEETQRMKQAEQARQRREEEAQTLLKDQQWRAQIDTIVNAMSVKARNQLLEAAVAPGTSFLSTRYADAIKSGNDVAAERYRYMLIEQALKEQGHWPEGQGQ